MKRVRACVCTFNVKVSLAGTSDLGSSDCSQRPSRRASQIEILETFAKTISEM